MTQQTTKFLLTWNDSNPPLTTFINPFQVYHRESEFYCSSSEVGTNDAKARKKEREDFYSLLHSTVLQINYTIDSELLGFERVTNDLTLDSCSKISVEELVQETASGVKDLGLQFSTSISLSKIWSLE